MKALLAKTATGTLRSKILDPKYKTAELVFEVNISPAEFAAIIDHFDDRYFELTIDKEKNT